MNTNASACRARAAGPEAWPRWHPFRASVTRSAFTVLEIMLALAIFAMVISAVYSSWSAILRSSRIGNEVAADVQRTRVAMQTVEDALSSAVLYAWNPFLYAFEADTSGEFAGLSFVSRLPPSFPGSGYFGDQVVRRVSFTVEQAEQGEHVLVLRQAPILQTNVVEDTSTPIILARNVTAFTLEFLQVRGNNVQWVEEWRMTNQLPKMIRFGMAFGEKPSGREASAKLSIRTATIISSPVQRDAQGFFGGQPGPGGVPVQNPGGRTTDGRAGGGFNSTRDQAIDLLPGSGQGVLRPGRVGRGGG